MNNYQEVREWLISLLDTTAKPFTPEINTVMLELWKKRESVTGEHRAIVNAFGAVLEYKQENEKFTPNYFEKQDRLKALWQKVLQRVRTLKKCAEE